MVLVLGAAVGGGGWLALHGAVAAACVAPGVVPVRKPGTGGSWPESVPAASGASVGVGDKEAGGSAWRVYGCVSAV